MAQDALDLFVVLEFFLEFASVGKFFLFARQKWFQRLGGVCLPEADVCVFTARNDVPSVHAIQNGIDLLHPLCVVNLARTAVIKPKDADRFVEGGRDEFSTSGGKVNVKYGLQMVLVNQFWLFQLAHVECVAV